MTQEFGIAVKAIIRKGDTYLVVVKSENEEIAPRSYDIPGGRVKFGETLEAALQREVKEETGLDVEIKKALNIWSFQPEKTLQIAGVTYLCSYREGTVRLSEEHTRYEWLRFSELKRKVPSWLLKEVELAESTII